MAKGIFNKNLSPCCVYCVYGKSAVISDEVFCIKRGVTNKNDACNKYKYDPLKRIPQKKTINRDFSEEDFKI